MHCWCPLLGETIGSRGSSARDDLSWRRTRAITAQCSRSTARPRARLRSRRRAKIAKRAHWHKREAAAVGGSASGPGTKQAQPQRMLHDPAFLVPVPLYCLPVIPGCAAFAGNIVNGAGGIGRRVWCEQWMRGWLWWMAAVAEFDVRSSLPTANLTLSCVL
ncbi:hypothetical protein GGX14DRAFT_388739 [Mycena pura]|uniref:Uncharacterized protein n=1 Tax=Mycena pura TaxID=153505 RepID=A0AAD6VSS0_9AGAR|nr:hypothetical protein GGX14DRAFT_388739 [Mycena pura]